MKKCFHCKASNKSESIYCIKCGSDLLKFYFCENCGNQYDDSVSFCPNDGGSIIEKKVSESIQPDLKSFKNTTNLVKLIKFSFFFTFFFPFISVFIIVNTIPDSNVASYIFILLAFLSPAATICFYFRWLFVSSKNLAALGVKDTQFSPLTTILWYFVPIINFVMMYRSMKEVWIYSENPINPKIKDNKPQLVLDWVTLVFLCIPASFFAIWFLIYITVKLTTQISDFQNKSYERLKGIDFQRDKRNRFSKG